MYWRESHRFSSRTPLKTLVKPQKQPLQLFYKKRCSCKFCKFHRKIPVFNRVTGQETQTQIFSCGVFEIFKNWSVRTTASETCCLTWSVLFNKFHLWLRLVHSFCIIIYSFTCEFPFTTSTIDTAIIRSSRLVVFCKKGNLANFAKFLRKNFRF